jgi:hypothetical protein
MGDVVANVTYNKDRAADQRAEKKEARSKRNEFRDQLTGITRNLTQRVKDANVTPEGATLLQAAIDEVKKWLAENTTASSDQMLDRLETFYDILNTLYTDDQTRFILYNEIKFWNVMVTMLHNENKVADDKLSAIQKNLDTNQLWYSKNLNDTLLTYQTKVEDINTFINTTIADTDIMAELNTKKASLDTPSTTVQLSQFKQFVEQAQAERQAREDSEFNMSRLFGKVYDGSFDAIQYAILLALALYSGAILANQVMLRPPSIRILYFIWGCLCFFYVLPYYIIQSIRGRPPFFASYMIPLYEYNPDNHPNGLSFFQKLVMYRSGDYLDKARNELHKAAEAALATTK